MIEVDVAARRLPSRRGRDEIAARLAAWRPAVAGPDSGYARLFFTHVEGADTGAIWRIS